MCMFKRLFQFLLLVLTIFVICIGAYTGYGYVQYKEFTNQYGDLISKVEEIQQKEDYISYDQLPQTLIEATVSIEDRRFFEHEGIDSWGLLRAIFSQFNDHLLRSGGSTITQQLAKNIYGMYQSGTQWKAAEFHFAKELEKHYTKEEIFTLYVNIINYGDNNTGIYQAAHGYFGVDPINLTDGQCTILAGIPQTPSRYELISTENIEQARERQLLILNAMVEMQYIDQTKADQIYQEEIF